MTPLRIFTAVLTILLAAGCGEPSAEEVAASTGAAGGGETTVLRFTAIPDENSTELERRFAPVADYLAAALGVQVEYVPVIDYPGSVEAFKNGDVQLAWFGGYTGIQARRAVEGARAIAQGEADPTFRSYFIAHKDTGIERRDSFPMDLAGKTFSFGSQGSTSGRLMPHFYIRQNTGKSPEEFFGKLPEFSKAHDKTAEWVQTGRVQAGALNYKTYDRMVEDGTIDPEVCRIVWVTPEYPDYNWTAHPKLDEWFGAGFIDKLQAALIAMDDPDLLAAVTRNKLIAARNEDFAAIEETAMAIGMLR